MDFSQVTSLIDPELLTLIPVLNIVGTGLKKTKFIKNWTIPLILGIIGIAVSILILGFEKSFSPLVIIEGVLQGIMAAGLSVYAHQVTVQTSRGKSE